MAGQEQKRLDFVFNTKSRRFTSVFTISAFSTNQEVAKIKPILLQTLQLYMKSKSKK